VNQLKVTQPKVTQPKARAEEIQRQLVQAKEIVEDISPSRTVICIGGLTIQGFSQGLLTLESDGYLPTTVFVSARANADIRLWGSCTYVEADREYRLITGVTKHIWNTDIYMDYTLPSNMVIICAPINNRTQAFSLGFAKIILSET